MIGSAPFSKAIMVVDEEPGRLRLIASHLQQAGFVPLTATRAEQALEILELLIPDVCILNSDVDGASGSALCSEIRTMAKSLPLLMLGWQDQVSESVLRDDFLSIPFVGYELVNKVERLLAVKQPA